MTFLIGERAHTVLLTEPMLQAAIAGKAERVVHCYLGRKHQTLSGFLPILSHLLYSLDEKSNFKQSAGVPKNKSSFTYLNVLQEQRKFRKP